MEERGTISYWSVLFMANSFSDLLGSLDFINEVMDYDRRVIQDLQTLQAEIAEKKAGLEANKAALEAAKAELETQKKQLSAQRDEANQAGQGDRRQRRRVSGHAEGAGGRGAPHRAAGQANAEEAGRTDGGGGKEIQH